MLTVEAPRLCVGVITPHKLIREGLAILLPRQDARVAVVDAVGGPGAEPGPAVPPTLVLLDSVAGPALAGVARRWAAARCPLVVLERTGQDGAVDDVPLGTPRVPISSTARELLEVLDRAPAAPPLLEVPARLTGREAEVLGYLAAGLSNREIGDRLFLGVNTVKTYLRTGYAKIGVSRRSQAVAWAVQHGLGPELRTVAARG